MADIKWNNVNASFNDANSLMHIGISGLSQAGDIFSKMREQMFKEQQAEIEHAYKEKALQQAFDIHKDEMGYKDAALKQNMAIHKDDMFYKQAALDETIRNNKANEVYHNKQIQYLENKMNQENIKQKALAAARLYASDQISQNAQVLGKQLEETTAQKNEAQKWLGEREIALNEPKQNIAKAKAQLAQVENQLANVHSRSKEISQILSDPTLVHYGIVSNAVLEKDRNNFEKIKAEEDANKIALTEQRLALLKDIERQSSIMDTNEKIYNTPQALTQLKQYQDNLRTAQENEKRLTKELKFNNSATNFTGVFSQLASKLGYNIAVSDLDPIVGTTLTNELLTEQINNPDNQVGTRVFTTDAKGKTTSATVVPTGKGSKNSIGTNPSITLSKSQKTKFLQELVTPLQKELKSIFGEHTDIGSLPEPVQQYLSDMAINFKTTYPNLNKQDISKNLVKTLRKQLQITDSLAVPLPNFNDWFNSKIGVKSGELDDLIKQFEIDRKLFENRISDFGG